MRSKILFFFTAFLLISVLSLPKFSSADDDDVLIRNSVDIIIAIDTTGSMQKAINAVRDNTNWFADQLEKKGFDYRLGLIDFKDVQFNQNPKWYNFTSNVNTFTSDVGKLKSGGGGGDGPESGIDAILLAKDKFAQYGRPEAGKMLILITDIRFHEPEDGYTTKQLGKLLGQKDIVTNFITTNGPKLKVQINNILNQTIGFQFNYAKPTADPDVHTAYEEILKQIGLNRPPVIQSVTYSENPVIAGESVNVNIKASDPDGDPLKYTLEEILPNGETRSVGTTDHASFTPDQPGLWKIHAIVTDSWGEGVEKIAALRVLAPDLSIAKVFPDPPPDKMFKNDPFNLNILVMNGGDAWSPPFEIQMQVDGEPVETKTVGPFVTGENKWVNFHFLMNKRQGNHTVKVVTDPQNKIIEKNESNNSRVFNVKIQNRAPVADFEWSPQNPVTGERVQIHSTSYDPDDDTLQYLWSIFGPDGYGEIIGMDNPAPDELTRVFDTPGDYQVNLLADDGFPNGFDNISKTITVNPRNTLNAQILHTKDWADKQGISRTSPDFVSGESFVIEATTTDNAKKVEVVPPKKIGSKQALTSNEDHTKWLTQIGGNEGVPDGTYNFTVRATYNNGQTIEKTLTITIAGKVRPVIHLTQ